MNYLEHILNEKRIPLSDINDDEFREYVKSVLDNSEMELRDKIGLLSSLFWNIELEEIIF